MKFRISQWGDFSNPDAEEIQTVYGIQANKGDGWKHLAKDGEPLLFDSLEEAGNKLEELRAQYSTP